MAAKRHERTYARKQAIQILYQADILDKSPRELLADVQSFVDGAKPSGYAAMLVAGVDDKREQIDDLLACYSENWAVDRMPAVDRAILRLAAFEMAQVDEVPVSVSINEAVELAKEYGGEDESPRFVNGVLGRIADYLGGNASASAPDGAEPDFGPGFEGEPESGIADSGSEAAVAAPALDWREVR